jgi:hypothetical protein
MTPATLTRATRLAQVHTQPISFVHTDLFSDQAEIDLRAFAAHPAFAKPLNTAVSQMLGLTQSDLLDDDLAQLETDVTLQSLCDLVSLPPNAFEQFLTGIAAVRLHGGILKCVLKHDLKMVQAQLGETYFDMAVREAPLVYPALKIDLSHADLMEVCATPSTLHAIGAGFLRAFVQTERPTLARLYDVRLPKTADSAAGDLNAAEIAAFRRFLRERLPR